MQEMHDHGTHEFLTVKELAELLRIKERKVYDLAASGEVPCSRATGKLLFPEQDIRNWIASASSGRPDSAQDRPTVFLGSHDPLLEWALRQSQCGLATFFDGSLDGLSRFRSGEGMAAGVHIRDHDSGEWNVPRVRELFAGKDVALIGWAKRRRGIVTAKRLQDKVKTLADLRGRSLAARQPESGTERLFSDLLKDEGIDANEIEIAEVARTELDAVLSVATGTAEATFGLEPLAQQFGLSFVPMIEERFDLVVDRRAWFEPPMQALLNFTRTDAFAAKATGTLGYDVTELGQVRWNA